MFEKREKLLTGIFDEVRFLFVLFIYLFDLFHADNQ